MKQHNNHLEEEIIKLIFLMSHVYVHYLKTLYIKSKHYNCTKSHLYIDFIYICIYNEFG